MWYSSLLTNVNTLSGNGKRKQKAETEKLKSGNGRQNSSLLYQYTGA